MEVKGYRRELALEAMLRLGKATGNEGHLAWAGRESAGQGPTPGSEANRRRGPFNCLVYWLYEATGDKDWLPGFIEQTQRYRRDVVRSPEGDPPPAREETRGRTGNAHRRASGLHHSHGNAGTGDWREGVFLRGGEAV